MGLAPVKYTPSLLLPARRGDLKGVWLLAAQWLLALCAWAIAAGQVLAQN